MKIIKTTEEPCGCVVSETRGYKLTKLCPEHYNEHFPKPAPDGEGPANLDLVS